MSPAPEAAVARKAASTEAFHDVVERLRSEPALAQVLGRSTATLAVPDAARALVVAALSRLSSRRPLVLALPTSTEAERVARDLAAYMGDEAGGQGAAGVVQLGEGDGVVVRHQRLAVAVLVTAAGEHPGNRSVFAQLVITS